jgi:hypothetical protein
MFCLQLQFKKLNHISLQVCYIDLHSCAVTASCIPWIRYAVVLVNIWIYSFSFSVTLCVITMFWFPNTLIPAFCSTGAVWTKIFSLHVSFLLICQVLCIDVYSGNFDIISIWTWQICYLMLYNGGGSVYSSRNFPYTKQVYCFTWPSAFLVMWMCLEVVRLLCWCAVLTEPLPVVICLLCNHQRKRKHPENLLVCW